MSEIFFISDTHFGHSRIIDYSSRPFKDVEDMNEQMVQNWNSLVKPNDTVYHNGDVAFMKLTDFKNLLCRTNGTWHIVLGNHDKMITQNRVELLKHGKIATIQHYNELKVAGEHIILFHYGMRVWNQSHRSSIMLYGHSHGNLPPFGKSVDIGVDCKEITPEYRPIHLDEILAYMKNRKSETVDHHLVKD